MANTSDVINTQYCLAWVDGELRVCRFSQGNIIYVPDKGDVVKVCRKNERTKWRYFKESQLYSSRGDFNQGEKVYIKSEDGVPLKYFVIDEDYKDGEGNRKYTVAR